MLVVLRSPEVPARLLFKLWTWSGKVFLALFNGTTIDVEQLHIAALPTIAPALGINVQQLTIATQRLLWVEFLDNERFVIIRLIYRPDLRGGNRILRRYDTYM